MQVERPLETAKETAVLDGKVQVPGETYDLWQKPSGHELFQLCDHDIEKLWDLIAVCERFRDVHWVVTRRSLDNRIPSQPEPTMIAYEQHPALGVVISPYYPDQGNLPHRT
jgi:hypothetical protein